MNLLAIGSPQWMKATPGRYGVYLNYNREWKVRRDFQFVATADSLAEAMDAAYADAEARAALAPTC